MSANNPLIARFAGEPTLVAPEQGQRFEAYLAAVAGHEHIRDMMAATTVASSEDFWNPGERDAWAMRYRPYIIVDGILQIPVKGVLLNNFPYQVGDWVTGYEYIWEAFKRGCGDYATGSIRGIALICDTPGGMVAGCFDARDRMIALKQETGCPVGGFAQESAYSAGYAMITVADAGQVYVSRTGGVGSIGVVTSHVDLSGMYEKMGVKVTFIASDPSKYEGNATEAPSKEFLERTQARIDELYAIFVSAVAQSRGLTEDVIRNDLKAYCYTAAQATSNGLADKIGTLDDSLSAFAGDLDEPSEPTGDEAMAEQAEPTVAQAVHDAAVATARTESAAAERELIFAIIDSEEAQKRPAAARALAAEGGRTLEQATAFLAKLPEEAAPEAAAPAAEPVNGFDAAMANGNPDVGASPAAKKGGEEAKDRGSKTLELAGAMGLKGFTRPAAK